MKLNGDELTNITTDSMNPYDPTSKLYDPSLVRKNEGVDASKTTAPPAPAAKTDSASATPPAVVLPETEDTASLRRKTRHLKNASKIEHI